MTGLSLLGHLLHVERLEFSGESKEEHRDAEDVGHPTLRSLRDVVADGVIDHLRVAARVLDNVALGVLLFMLDAVIVEPFDRVDVGHTEEGALGCSEVGVELLDERGRDRVRKEDLYCVANLEACFRDRAYEGGAGGLTMLSICAMRSLKSMKPSSASRWVYSLK